MSFIKSERCELCGHGEAVKRTSMVTCSVDPEKPAQVIWSHWCKRFVAKKEEVKK